MESSELVITHSLVKAFKGCQNEAKYKYVDLLTPKLFRSKPLKRGIWFHEMLEANLKGESVSAVHKRNTHTFNQMFDEEKEALGVELPQEMEDLYRSYRWHYRADNSWKVHEVEIKLEAELPNGQLGQGKADALIEDDYGLWFVDHKTHLTLPTWSYRLLDQQAPYYIWLGRKMGIPVRGFIWNYVVPKGPKPLKFNKNGALSKVLPAITDFPTVEKNLTDEQRAMPDVQDILAKLYMVQYDRDIVQTSPVFRRDLLEPDDETIEAVIADISTTGSSYAKFRRQVDTPGFVVPRTVSRSCEWCDFRSLCIAELTGQNADGVRRREFSTHDPFDYYKELNVPSL